MQPTQPAHECVFPCLKNQNSTTTSTAGLSTATTSTKRTTQKHKPTLVLVSSLGPSLCDSENKLTPNAIAIACRDGRAADATRKIQQLVATSGCPLRLYRKSMVAHNGWIDDYHGSPHPVARHQNVNPSTCATHGGCTTANPPSCSTEG